MGVEIKIEAIDLFCGVGGLTYGLRKANIDVVAGLDNDETCRYPFEKNNKAKFISADISEYDFSEMLSLYSEDSIRVLVGCAPCQPFSTHTNKVKDKENNDNRWNLLNYFVEAIRVLKPHIISMENVRGLTKTQVFEDFKNDLKQLDYEIDADVVYCPDYGIPQSRSRLVLLASNIGKIEIPKATHSKKSYKTVEQVLKKLPPLKAGEQDPKDPVHRCKTLSPTNMNRMKASKPGGSWKDWNENLLPECYKRDSGQTYSSVYGRMSWNAVSPTMTTQFTTYGTGRFGHPEQDRALSMREGAILQTFPKKYDFGKEISFQRTTRHIGNAVPPRLGFVIGKRIIEHVRAAHERGTTER